MLRIKENVFRIWILFVAFIISLVSIALYGVAMFLASDVSLLNLTLSLEGIEKTATVLLYISGGVLAGLIIQFLLSHKIHKGFRYFARHLRITHKLKRQLLDANFGISRRFHTALPKIWLDFEPDLLTGHLELSNSLKFNERFDNINLSAALCDYMVEFHYLSDNGNRYIYELVDANTDFKLTFNSFEDFLEYNHTIPEYKVFLDGRSVIPIQSSLFVGQTGSGKSYTGYSLILQLLNKHTPCELYYADPKQSGLAVIGSIVAEERTADETDDIIDLLETFVQHMTERKAELKGLLKTKLDADYSDFDLNPHVFTIDEYATFSSAISTRDKATRDKVKNLVYQIILEGRQLGFFLFCFMQKADSTLIDTALRENMPLKIVLGNSEAQTYNTAFGQGIDIPDRHYLVGEGVFTEPRVAPQPKLARCTECNFDMVEAFTKCRAGVM